MRIATQFLDRPEPLLDGLLRGGLQILVHGGVHDQAAVFDLLIIQHDLKVPPHRLHHVVVHGADCRLCSHGHVLFLGGFGLLGGDEFFHDHAVQDHVAFCQGSLPVAEWGELVGAADDAGERGRFAR